MRRLRPMLLALLCVCAVAQQPTTLPSAGALDAAAIMARVATNQDRAEGERGRYIFVQHTRMSSRKGKTVMCEEVTDSRVTPSEKGSQQQLLKLDGRMLTKHGVVTYTSLAAKEGGKGAVENDHDSASVEVGGDDTDRDLVENMRKNLTQDGSKDGINARLFPLSSKGQEEYLFHLVGSEHMNGREVFHVSFRPKDKSGFGWKGDAYIDTTAYEPVVVRTDMARKVPIAVRTLLGTNVPGLGFNIIYAPQPDGVWLPVSFGTEFKLHVLFFFSREIVLDAQNRDFEKTHVSSRIVEPGEVAQPE